MTCVEQQTRGFLSYFNLHVTQVFFCKVSWCLHTKSTINVCEIIRVSLLFTDLRIHHHSLASSVKKFIYTYYQSFHHHNITRVSCGPLERNIFYLHRCSTYFVFVFFLRETECIVKKSCRQAEEAYMSIWISRLCSLPFHVYLLA